MKKKMVVSPIRWIVGGASATLLLGFAFAAGTTEVKTRAISDMFYKDTLPKPVAPKVAAKTKDPETKPEGPSKPDVVKVSAPGPSRRRVGLKYRIQMMATSGGSAVDVDAQRTFRTGEAIRIVVESNIDGYLYILQRGSSGRETMIFPSPEINGGSNLVKANTVLTVPWNGFFKFDSVPGREKWLLVVSRSPLENLPKPEADAPSSEPAPMSILMAELGKSVRSRDLVFVKEETPAPAGSDQPPQQAFLWVNASTNDNNQAVYATVELNHQ